jgi:hypothetical protein
MRKGLRVSFRAPVEVSKRDGKFVASCYLLDAPHEAPSKDAAIQRVAGAIQSLMYLRLRNRSLDTFLWEHELRAQQAFDGISAGPYVDVSVTLGDAR